MKRIGPEPVLGHPAPGMHIWGWMSPRELTWLHATAGAMANIAEIGSLHGRSAYALLSGCPGPVYCIDPWDDVADESYASFLGACGRFPNLRAVRGLSPAAAALVPDVDMVFIDGAHDYDSVVADIAAWLPKARRLICGHDYNHPGYPGVKAAVDEVFGERVHPAIGDGWGDGTRSIWAVDITPPPATRHQQEKGLT